MGIRQKDCILTINEAEAQVVRRVFHLYANEQMGIRHILENPKYKGWYCANKSQTVDYRSKRKIFLDEREWVMYLDHPSRPLCPRSCGIGLTPSTSGGAPRRRPTGVPPSSTTATHTVKKSSAKSMVPAFTGKY